MTQTCLVAKTLKLKIEEDEKGYLVKVLNLDDFEHIPYPKTLQIGTGLLGLRELDKDVALARILTDLKKEFGTDKMEKIGNEKDDEEWF